MDRLYEELLATSCNWKVHHGDREARRIIDSFQLFGPVLPNPGAKQSPVLIQVASIWFVWQTTLQAWR